MAQRPNQVACVCKTCGKEFTTKASNLKHKGRGQYCSKDCFNAVQNKRGKFICPTCGKSFERTFAKVSDDFQPCCSKRCAGIQNRVRTLCTCKQCGKQFDVKTSKVIHGAAKYCSVECSANARSGVNNPLWKGGHRSLRGSNWARQRNAAYKRDGGICQICHKKPKVGKRKLTVHHIIPYRLFNGDYLSANQLSNLVTLCPKCHKQVEIGNIPSPVHLF